MGSLLESARWKTSADGLSAELAPPRSRAVFLIFAAFWNIGLSQSFPPLFATLGLVAGLFLSLWAVREFLFRSRFSFKDGRFTFSAGPIGLRARVEVPLSEIAAFSLNNLAPHPSTVKLVLRDGSVRVLGVQVDSFILWLNAGRRIPIAGVAKSEDYVALVTWLNDALDKATHAGGMYRIAPGNVTIPEAEEGEEPAEERERARQK
jgi:hypothetical protein